MNVLSEPIIPHGYLTCFLKQNVPNTMLQIWCCSQYRLKQIRLACDHYRKSRGQEKVFEEVKHQLTGSNLQEEHHQDIMQKHMIPGHSPYVKHKASSAHAISYSKCCNFSFTIFCSRQQISSGKWYVASSDKLGRELSFMHSNHLPVNQLHLVKHVNSIPHSLLQELKLQITSGISVSVIANYVRTKYKMLVSKQQILSMKKSIIQDLVTSAGESPSHSAAEHLIQVFKTYEDVSNIYVKHCMDHILCDIL